MVGKGTTRSTYPTLFVAPCRRHVLTRIRAALQVTSVTDGSGAIINGTIEPGDIISEVDNVLPSCAKDILFGAKDSVVKLTVISASGSDFECTVMRNVPVRVWQRWHRKEVLCACRLNRVPVRASAGEDRSRR